MQVVLIPVPLIQQMPNGNINPGALDNLELYFGVSMISHFQMRVCQPTHLDMRVFHQIIVE